MDINWRTSELLIDVNNVGGEFSEIIYCPPYVSKLPQCPAVCKGAPQFCHVDQNQVYWERLVPPSPLHGKWLQLVSRLLSSPSLTCSLLLLLLICTSFKFYFPQSWVSRFLRPCWMRITWCVTYKFRPPLQGWEAQESLFSVSITSVCQ